MANLKIVPGTTKTLFTGTVTISGKTGRIELQKAEFQDQQGKKVERFVIWSPNFPGCPFLGFTVPGAFSSLEDACHCLCEVGLKLESNPKNQGMLIFQAETDFMGHPAVGVKIYKTANNDYECVLSKLFNPPCAPLYERNSFTESTLEEIFSQIENLKTFYRLWILKQKQIYGSTPNPDF